MSLWEQNEEKHFKYFVENYGDIANFEHKGGSNSNTSDILVNSDYYIESKSETAQAGQFATSILSEEIVFSKKNKTPFTTDAQIIIDRLNENFDKYKNVGTENMIIESAGIEEAIINWLIHCGKIKNTKLIITGNNIVFSPQNIANYFDVKAVYRRKKSGSSNVPKKDIGKVSEHIKECYNISDIEYNGKKMFIPFEENLNNIRFELDGETYMFSQRDDKLEIRKLSKTNNATVIFELKLKKNIKGMTDEEIRTAIGYLK